MIAIHKYPLPFHTAEIQIPHGATLLHVGTQREAPYLWAIVNTENPVEYIPIWAQMTGEEIPPDIGFESLPYLGTCIDVGGWAVIHYFTEPRFRNRIAKG